MASSISSQMSALGRVLSTTVRSCVFIKHKSLTFCFCFVATSRYTDFLRTLHYVLWQLWQLVVTRFVNTFIGWMFLNILFRFQDSTHPEQLCLARWTMSLLTAPPLPKYQSTFDIVPVLAYVQSLPTANISLQLLSFKTLFLTVYSSISRVGSVARLGPSLQEHRDSVVLHFIFLGKTGGT